MDIFRDKYNNLRARLAAKGVDDPRLFGILLLATISLLVLWNGARVVQQNYGLLQKITLLEEENRIIELENRNKQIQNEYYKTPEYAELKARRVNGRAASGEQVYLISDETALRALKTSEDKTQSEENAQQKPAYQQNFESWMEFFFND